MSFKENLIQSIEQETVLIKLIYNLLPEGSLDFSPGENMRTTMELIRYLPWCCVSMVKWLIISADDTEAAKKVFKPYMEKAENMPIEEFPVWMDAQVKEIKELLEPLSDEVLDSKTVTIHWDEEKTLAGALMECPLKWLTGYKMQLFLYTKMCGVPELNTMHCWIGMPPQDAGEDVSKDTLKE